MHKKEVAVFDATLQKTHIWLKDIAVLMGWTDQHLSYLALRAVLHALRDRLPVEVAAKFGAQLPLLIRGIFYEGWVPLHTPLKIYHIEDFLGLVLSYLGNDLLYSQIEPITETVFTVIEKHLSKGQIKHIKSVLPEPISIFLEQSVKRKAVLFKSD